MQQTVSEIEASFRLSSVHTTPVHGPCQRAMSTGREHGCPTQVSTCHFGQPYSRWPCSRSPVYTTRDTAREHGCHFGHRRPVKCAPNLTAGHGRFLHHRFQLLR